MKEENITMDAKAVIIKSYQPDMRPTAENFYDKRKLILYITSEKELPDEFFTELSELVEKYQK
jgi:hypothetical protein